ncbi:hypothetical protein [Nitratireductor sp. GCM10026969]|uniref:hypothetical protein n=1 Tax=Nitratireductor sp. GCM10026969 TaxID=3252645 RepID=UPI00361ECFEC
MADTGFDYFTPAFRLHAAPPGFWLYAEPVPGRDGRFRLRPGRNAGPLLRKIDVDRHQADTDDIAA